MARDARAGYRTVRSGAGAGESTMKIAVFGSGGIGGYFGARLAASGGDVHFIARGAHLEAMRAGGLRVRSAKGDLHMETVHATDDPAAIGPADVVVVAV